MTNEINIYDMKWAVQDKEYGNGVAHINELFENDEGVKMCNWQLTLPVHPYGCNYEQSVETFIQYLEENDAVKHWTVGA